MNARSLRQARVVFQTDSVTVIADCCKSGDYIGSAAAFQIVSGIIMHIYETWIYVAAVSAQTVTYIPSSEKGGLLWITTSTARSHPKY